MPLYENLNEQSGSQVNPQENQQASQQAVKQGGQQQADFQAGQPFGGQEQVVAVRKNSDGDIVQLKLSSGQVVDYKQAQQMAKNNQIQNVNVFRGRDGEEHLRSNPDGREDNNLDNLPTF